MKEKPSINDLSRILAIEKHKQIQASDKWGQPNEDEASVMKGKVD